MINQKSTVFINQSSCFVLVVIMILFIMGFRSVHSHSINLIGQKDSFYVRVDQSEGPLGITKIALFMNSRLIFNQEETRSGVGGLVNYDKNNDSVFLQNPYKADSLVLFVTDYYSNQICNFISLKDSNYYRSKEVNYFFIINDINDKSIIYFNGSKYGFWENGDSLAELVKVSYTGSPIKSIYIKFDDLSKSYNLFSKEILDEKFVKMILDKFN